MQDGPVIDVHIPTPEICDYITLHWKRDFRGIIKLRILAYPLFPGRSKVITRVIISERRRQERGDLMIEAVYVLLLHLKIIPGF